MTNIVSNITVEWPTVLMTLAFVAAGWCTYALIKLVAKLVLSLIGPLDDDIFEEEDEDAAAQR